jgi:hypothetical protein
MKEVADGGVVPPDHDRVGLGLLTGQYGFVFLEPAGDKVSQLF